jgi:protoporphyrinogen oxidase
MNRDLTQQMREQQHSHIVIGGGISGLSAAYYAARSGIDTLVVEREARLGGCMQTHVFNELDGFWVEAGSHSCFNSYGNLLGILEQVDLLQRATAKAKQSYALWNGGERKSIMSALHLPELVLSLPRLFTRSKADCSVAEYYGAGLGERNYRDLLGPAFRSVICQQADDFPAEALFRKKPRRKDVLRSFTMPNGLAEIPIGIGASGGIEIQSGSGVAGIEAEDDHYVVRLDGGAELRCAHLTMAVPPDVAAKLLKRAAPDAAAIVGQIAVAEIDSLLLAFPKSALSVPQIAGLISVDGAFLSAVSRDFLADDQWRGFAFHFPGGKYSEQERERAACAALDCTPDKAAAIAHATNRLPRLRKGHRTLVDSVDSALAGRPIAITGNWFLGVSIEDCVTRSLGEHQRLFGAATAQA